MESRNRSGEKPRERSSEAIREAHEKLNLLMQTTRHDIRSNLRQIGGFARLARMRVEDPEVQRYLVKIDEIVAASNRAIDFSKDYQNIGLIPPSWQNLSGIIRNALAMLPSFPIPVIYNVDKIEVCADHLISAVFRNLFDNAIRHGQKTTFIRIHFLQSHPDLILIVDDDGIGLSSEKKLGIFRQDSSEDSLNGLSLCRQILGITGMSIRETGQTGRGARFEIIVPEGKYRINRACDEMTPVQSAGR